MAGIEHLEDYNVPHYGKHLNYMVFHYKELIDADILDQPEKIPDSIPRLVDAKKRLERDIIYCEFEKNVKRDPARVGMYSDVRENLITELNEVNTVLNELMQIVSGEPRRTSLVRRRGRKSREAARLISESRDYVEKKLKYFIGAQQHTKSTRLESRNHEIDRYVGLIFDIFQRSEDGGYDLAKEDRTTQVKETSYTTDPSNLHIKKLQEAIKDLSQPRPGRAGAGASSFDHTFIPTITRDERDDWLRSDFILNL